MPASSTRRNPNRARCRLTDCHKFAQTRGLCKAHGGGSRCRHQDCHKLAQSRGLCIAHGGGRRCSVDDCNKLAQSKGHCISHGGGRRCAIPHCDKFSQVRGYCKAHAKVLMVFRTPSSPTRLALMTPPACASSSKVTTLSPVNSKLSIDFLVNPSLPSEQPNVRRPQCNMPVLQLSPLVTEQGPHTMDNRRSLLSFLKPGSTMSPSIPFRPLVLDR